MASRLNLHEELVSCLGTNNVYYQPPENLKLNYPCFIYSLNNIDLTHADDKNYLINKSYSITYVDRNPDTDMPDRLLNTFNKISFNRSYPSNNLHHFVFTLFY